ncbi:MAG: MarR family transcriptional regulator, partial [Gammaproteobacteria bacterium]|nr:MarR family transcriptional regulator [Gammaproteobacteria bacterium]
MKITGLLDSEQNQDLYGRFDNESIFLTDGTTHHNDFCWRLGDAMHSHMRAHPYALNGTFLADTSETRSSALQFPVVKNKTSRKNNILTRKRVLEDTMSPALGPQVHEAFSRLARRLRALELPYGLTNERLSTLATLVADEPVSLSALAKAEIVSLPTMSRMVDALEAEGFVKRRDDKFDSRAVLVSTTAKGRRSYQREAQQSLS